MDGGTKGERATETFLKGGGNWWRVSVAQLEVSFFSAKREKNLLGGRQGREEREETIFAITPTHT